VFDHDNPEWTDEDFAAARAPETLPSHILAAFPETYGQMAYCPDDPNRILSETGQLTFGAIIRLQSHGARLSTLAA